MTPDQDAADERLILLAAWLFPSLSVADVRSLAPECSFVRLKGGETLFAAGEPGDSLYAVIFGRLRALLANGTDGEQVLGEIGRGEAVGEMAVLTGAPRSVTVCAIRDTELVKLTKTGFERLAAQHPSLMLDLSRLIIERYQRVLRPTADVQPVALAVIPCGPDIPVAEFTAGLVRALSPGRKVLSLNSEQAQRERRTETPSWDAENSEVGNWLHELEWQHDFLVYAADPRPSPWTRLCIRQADVVLLVGAGSASQLEPVLLDLLEGADATGKTRKELVLLYDSARETPHGTAEWLARIPVSSHHHLDPSRPQDYERLARMLTGRAIGLVLGAGGARGFAHIGVIRALEEARIPIDLVGGTSIGAVIAGQYASGWDSARIQTESRKVFVEAGSLNDFTLPMMALLHGRRYTRMLETLFGDRFLEDAPLSCFCVSTNLTRGEVVVHRTGLLRKWVAASMAVPGLGPPIFDGRDILVDGGVLNGLPVDVMQSFGRGPVFASSVSSREELRLDREYPDIPSPWRVLFSRLNPFGTPIRVPSIAGILIRTASLPRVSPDAHAQPADLVFEPPIVGHKLLDWHSLDTLVEIGYRSAVTAIEKWERRSRDV